MDLGGKRGACTQRIFDGNGKVSFKSKRVIDIGALFIRVHNAPPTEDAGWGLPDPDGDYLRFHLPFTFNFRGRIGILAFFDRKLLDHGEGGAGRFFSEVPKLSVDPEPRPQGGFSYVPSITATIGLKPFDLGVSQKLAIAMPPDEESREYKVRIEIQRLSGTRDSWLRLNRDFVSQIRQHFLHWRALSLDDRDELFAEARDRLAAKNLSDLGSDRILENSHTS